MQSHVLNIYLCNEDLYKSHKLEQVTQFYDDLCKASLFKLHADPSFSVGLAPGPLLDSFMNKHVPHIFPIVLQNQVEPTTKLH